MNALALASLWVQAKPERTWRIETPGETAFSVRLPTRWRPAGRIGRAKRKKGVETTPFFGAPDGSQLFADFAAKPSKEDLRAASAGSFARTRETARVVSRKFVRGGWTGVVVTLLPKPHATHAGLDVSRGSVHVAMSDGRTVRMLAIAGPKDGALPNEALAIRICETIVPVAKRP